MGTKYNTSLSARRLTQKLTPALFKMSASLPFERLKNIDTKHKFAVAGYIRNTQKSEIPESIQLIILLFYYATIEVMKFCTTIRTQGKFELSDDDKCLKSLTRTHGYILADAVPVKAGVHCWRMKV